MPITTEGTVFIDNKILIPVKLGHKLYHIGCDRYNFMFGTVKDTEVKKDGTMGKTFHTEDTSFYSSLESLMTALQKRKLKNMSATTINELQNNIRKSKEEVIGLYKELTTEELRNG